MFPHHIQAASRGSKENPPGGEATISSFPSSSSSSPSARTLTNAHCLVLDLSSVNFMDSVAMTAFSKVRKEIRLRLWMREYCV